MVGQLVMLPVRVGVRATRLWFRVVEETVTVSATATGRVIELLTSRGSGGDGAGSGPGWGEDGAGGAPRSGGDGASTAPGSGAEDAGGTAPGPATSTTEPRSRRAGAAERDEVSDSTRVQARPDDERPQARRDVERAQTETQTPTEVHDFASPPAQPAPAPPLSAEPAHVSEEPELVEELAEPGAEEGAGAQVRVEPPWDGYGKMNAKQVLSRLASASPAELAAVELYEGSHRRRQTILNAVDRELRHANGSGSPTQERGRIDG